MSKSKKIALGCGGLVGLLFIIIIISAIFGGGTPNEQKATTPAPQAVTNQPTIRFAFDIPILIGKNIDEVRQVLGAPLEKKDLVEPTATMIKLGGDQWDNSFDKDGKELLVTFKAIDRSVVDFFISTDDSSGATKDKNHLLELGNLQENSSKYTIEFVKVIKDPSSFTGVKIKPNL